MSSLHDRCSKEVKLSVQISNHEHLSELQARVHANVEFGYIRLNWMEEGEPFEVKSFVLNQLSRMHIDLCNQHIHDMQNLSGGSHCRYCPWGWGGSGSDDRGRKPGIEV